MRHVSLRPTNLHWINESADDPNDLCAHSAVEFRVGDTLVRRSDGDWTVSAAALYLLRTLSQPHTASHPVADHLFPCCGHAMFEAEGEEDVVIIGCPNGVDFELVHADSTVALATKDGRLFEIAYDEWRRAVCEFADVVQGFYASSTPKTFEDEDAAKGFRKFWAEWHRRHET